MKKNNNSISALILQSNIMPTNTARQLQDEENGQKIVLLVITKLRNIHTLNTLTLTQMELDVRLNHGK